MWMEQIDIQFLIHLRQWTQNYFADWFFPFYTDIHKQSWFLISFLLPLLILWVYAEFKNKVWIVSFFVLNLVITDSFCGQIIKKSFARERPFVVSSQIEPLSPASGFSFVSNHAANSFAMATFLSAFYPEYKFVFWILAVLTSFSRLYNGVHFTTDVIAGGFMGFLIAKSLLLLIRRKFIPYHTQKTLNKSKVSPKNSEIFHT